MHLFNDYIQPLTIWLQAHPNLALLITFLVALTESLAIIGSIVPGSVTMTAIGILAGSGVMRIDLTLLAATLGAIAGDGASYLLGYAFSDRLSSTWPFSRYPNWLDYGKDYFAKHGGKSILIGRFVGPLRSIIPVIAGMMHMSHWRFFIANSISGLGWAMLYVFPGVLIGTASSELSPETATRLFILILLLLAAAWLLSMALKWLFIRLRRLLRKGLHDIWVIAASKPYLAKTLQFLSPEKEEDHCPTAALLLFFFVSTLILCLIIASVRGQGWLNNLNQPILLLLQSLRTYPFDIFFTLVRQLTSPFTMAVLSLTIILLIVKNRDWRSLAYWLSLNLSCVLALTLIHLLVNSPRPLDLMDVASGSSFPINELSFATAFFLVFNLYLNAYCQARFTRIIKATLGSGLLLAGLAPLYLGDHWFTDCLAAYFCGLSLGLIHWAFYRRQKPELHCAVDTPIILLLLLLLASTFSALLGFSASMRNHQLYFTQYVFTDELWWNQTRPLLPIYRRSRIGHPISLFNIQYAGALSTLENALTAHGWQKQDDSLFNTLLVKFSGQSSSQNVPLMAQLYLNRKPVLVMTYESSGGKPAQILRIWRSNYHLKHYRQPIWLGSVHPRSLLNKKELQAAATKNQPSNKPSSLLYVSRALSEVFIQRSLALPAGLSKQPLPAEAEPVLLLIREKT